MKKLALIICILVAGICQAEDENDGKPSAALQFKKAQQILASADNARDKGNTIGAARLYKNAALTYSQLSRIFPQWQPEVTQFRIEYSNNKLDALFKDMDANTIANIKASFAAMEKNPEILPVVQSPPDNRKTKNRESVQSIPKNINTTSIESIKAAARQLLEKGEMEKTRNILLDGLQKEPDDKTLRMFMGIVHCQANEFDNAVYLIEPLVQEDRSNVYSRIILGTAYFGLGRITDAEREMREALKLDPKMAEAHYNLAQILLSGSPADTNAAISHYKTALNLGTKPDSSLNLLLLDQPSEKK